VSSKAQAKKDKIISGLVETRRRILDAASSLSPEEQDEIFLGVWSVKDLLAHLVGWDFTNLEAAKAILAGRLPNFYPCHDRDWKTYNARLVAEYKRDDFADLLSSGEGSHRMLVDFLKTIPAEDFDKDKGVRFKGHKVTIARLLQVEIDDEKTHLTQIEGFRDRSNPFPVVSGFFS
jgi:hypothetical protein